MSEHNLSSHFFSALTENPRTDQPNNAESRPLANWRCEQRQTWRTANSSGEKQPSWRDSSQGQRATSALSSWREKLRVDEWKSTNVFTRKKPNVAENSTSLFGGPRNKFGTNFKTSSNGSATSERASARSAFGESKRKFGSNLSIASDCSTAPELPDPQKRQHRSFGSSWSSASESRAAGNRNFNRHASNNRAESSIDPKTGNRVESTKSPKLSLKYLEALSRKGPREIALEVTIAKAPFVAFLEKSPLEPDWLILIVSIVAKVCDSDFEGNRSDVLYKLCKSPFFDTLSNYLGDVSMETDPSIIEKLPEFMKNLCEFYASLLDAWPMVAVEKNLKKMITKTKVAISNITDYLKVQIDENIGSKLETYTDKLDDYKKMQEEKKSYEKRIRSKVQQAMDSAPSEDFRRLSVYPTKDDLFRTQRGFVRPNKTRGAYLNVEHYLDVQFRLLREDFVDSVRSGVQKYLSYKSESQRIRRFKFDNVRVYPETVIQSWGRGCERDDKLEVGIRLNFDPREKFAATCDWLRSKRFMHGSLLLLTADDFNTFVCVTVMERDADSLKKGLVLAALVGETPDIHKMLAKPFTMVESEVFFEPYFLILQALKKMDDSSFPMPEYIVKGQPETKSPLYPDNEVVQSLYTNYSRNLYSDLDLDDEDSFPDDDSRWLNLFLTNMRLPAGKDSFKLDEYQSRAFEAGLNRDFCVIQGPPGTGKTFLGLKIVKSILHKCSNSGKKLPILIICLTNHALDQFLESIVKFTDRIVRVGGQSRNDKLNFRNLRVLRNTLPHLYQRRNRDYDFVSMSSQIMKRISTLGENIETAQMIMKNIELPEGILSTSLLKLVVHPNHLTLVENDQTLFHWLLDDNEYETSVENDFENFCHLYENEPMVNEVPEPVAKKKEKKTLINFNSIYVLKVTSNYSVTHDALKKELESLKGEYDSLIKNENSLLEQGYDFSVIYFEKTYLKNQIKTLTRQYHKLKNNLEAFVGKSPAPVVNTLHLDPWELPSKLRWQIYWSWLSHLQKKLSFNISELETRRRVKMIQYEEYRMFEDLDIMRQAHVVGMTTTGAARLNKLLGLLKPAIVIVEEAAEVLEAHIVASLTVSCRHLILIGDHKQLRPSSAVYELSKHYNIDVSLFERMINNGMHCPMLKVQHRMRPEIASLIAPLIYPDLENHESVLSLEPVRGTTKNMFFVEHNFLEQVTDEETSKENLHEAQFVVKLASYFVQQGYNREKITLLTFYTGQMLLIRNLIKNNDLLGVKCVVVDKYQGEENEIILLSLVRSNAEGSIGFLSIENRICVALSRAKNGLFMMGNMDCLAKSRLWQKLRDILKKSDSIGKELPLYCNRHDKITLVSTAADFHALSNGGCASVCNMEKECGHLCQKICHFGKDGHESDNCKEPCMKLCPRNHRCKNLCNEVCEPCKTLIMKVLPCEHVVSARCYDKTVRPCAVLVGDVLLPCNHTVERMCHQQPEEVKCTAVCGEPLECGHCCTRRCHINDPKHDPCRRPCKKFYENCQKSHSCKKFCYQKCGDCPYRDEVKLICGHQVMVSCSSDLSTVKCPFACNNICSQCNLKCKKKCWEECHPCMNKVKKIIPTCGHEIIIDCWMEPNKKLCRENCQSMAPCGHKCQLMCGETCSSIKCKEWVTSTDLKPACGHEKIYVLCGAKDKVSSKKPEDFLANCQEPCNAILECGDVCNGSCNQCLQGRMHKTCQKLCGRTFICGHRCKFPCQKLCPPCMEPCSYRCVHSKCTQKCGIPCPPCKKPCQWKCKHSKCTRKCGDICNRQPCNKPCELKLPCGHDCIGYCGEPCPLQCRFCNPEVTNIVFGYEAAPDARFVLMVDCNHTIESRALNQYFCSGFNNGEIMPRGCPLCGTPVTKTLRFMNDIKRMYQQIAEVKTKTFEELRSFDSKKYFQTWSSLYDHHDLRVIHDFIYFCCTKLPNGPRNVQIFSPEILTNLIYFSQVCRTFTSRLDEFDLERKRGQLLFSIHAPKVRPLIESYLKKAILKMQESVFNANRQLMFDFNLELRRYHLMADYLGIKDSCWNRDRKIVNLCAEIERKLFGFARFTDSEEAEIKCLFELLKSRAEVLAGTSSLPEKSTTKKDENEMPRIFKDMTAGRWFQCTNGHYYYKGVDGCTKTALAGCPECVEKGPVGKQSGRRRRRRR